MTGSDYARILRECLSCIAATKETLASARRLIVEAEEAMAQADVLVAVVSNHLHRRDGMQASRPLLKRRRRARVLPAQRYEFPGNTERDAVWKLKRDSVIGYIG
jgi:hypothetical protein